MELRHFRYFVTLAETLHFAHAAELLGIAPPTLTVQIQDIEQQLGARLFARTKRTVSLTPAGEAFLAEARIALAQAERAILIGQRAGRGELGRIEIGYVGSAAYAGVLQTQLNTFRQTWPDVLINVRELPMAGLPAMLVENRIDIAFVRLPMTLPTRLRSHVLLRDKFCLALPAGHPLALHDGPVRARMLAGESFIVPEQVLGTYEIARRGRFTPSLTSAPGTLIAVLTEVSLGAGVAVLPNVMASVVALPNVVFKTFAGEPVVSEVAAIFRSFEPAVAVSHLIGQMTASAPISLRQMAV